MARPPRIPPSQLPPKKREHSVTSSDSLTSTLPSPEPENSLPHHPVSTPLPHLQPSAPPACQGKDKDLTPSPRHETGPPRRSPPSPSRAGPTLKTVGGLPPTARGPASLASMTSPPERPRPQPCTLRGPEAAARVRGAAGHGLAERCFRVELLLRRCGARTGRSGAPRVQEVPCDGHSEQFR